MNAIPMDKSREIYVRALTRAAARVGGSAELARRLGVPSSKLADWVEGSEPPDRDMLLRILEIAMDEDGADT